MSWLVRVAVASADVRLCVGNDVVGDVTVHAD